ncbi:MAG: PDZ domain-containing protein [Bryobacterales bacterium]|nr:PDZ domain-containing protein [Bryobacterales bacterium]
MEINTPRNRYIAILASVAVLILVVGWQIRPRKNSDSPMSQADLTRLARLSQRSNLDGMASFFADVARQVSGGLVWVEGLDTGGLVWDATGTILVSTDTPNSYQRAWLRGSDESELPLQTELYSGPLSFRMLKSPPELALDHLRQATVRTMRTGSWMVRVWKTSAQTHEFETGLLSAVRPITCDGIEAQELLSSFTDEKRTLGSGVFDLEGRLVGVTLSCAGTPRVLLSESLTRAIERARAVDSQIQFRYGFLAAELTPKSKEYFSSGNGLLVEEVWRDTLAWELGLRPGDVITAQDAEPVNRIEDLAMMTVPMYRPEYPLTVRRGRSSRKISFPPGAGLADEPSPLSRTPLAFEGPPTGVQVRSVSPDSPVARAGLQPGDRIVSMGPQFGAGRLDPAAVTASREGPLFLVVERADKLIGLFLE